MLLKVLFVATSVALVAPPLSEAMPQGSSEDALIAFVKEQLVNQVCAKDTSPNCAEKTVECMELLQFDATGGLGNPGTFDLETTCASSNLSIGECSKKVIKCSELLSSLSDGPPSGPPPGFGGPPPGFEGPPPGFEGPPPGFGGPTDPSGPSESSGPGQDGPSREEIEVMCSFMEIPDCSTRLWKCFQDLGAGATADSSLNIQELLECQKLITQYTEAAQKFAESIGAGGPPGFGDPADLSEPSENSTDPPVASEGSTNASVASETSGQGPSEDSTVPSAASESSGPGPSEGSTDPSAASESSGPGPSEGSTDPSEAPESSGPGQVGPSKEELEVMCAFTEIPDCSTRLWKCFQNLEAGPTLDNSLNIEELLECQTLITQYTEAAQKFAESIGSPSGAGGPPPGFGGPTDLSGASENSTNPSGTSEGTTDPSGASESSGPGQDGPSKQEVEAMCTFTDIPNCSTRLWKCFQNLGAGATADISLNIQELLECQTLISQYTEAAQKFAQSVGAIGVPGSEGSGPGSSDGSGDTGPGGSGGPGGPEDVTRGRFNCTDSENPSCVERLEKCFGILTIGSTPVGVPTKEVFECAAVYTSLIAPPPRNSSLKELTCESEKCKTCEGILQAPDEFIKTAMRCAAEVIDNPDSPTLKECMDPHMKKFLKSVGAPEIRPKLLEGYQTCQPIYDFGNISKCLTVECAKVV